MKECNYNIQRIATNLTSDEFKAYCKAMSLHWFFKMVDYPSRNPTAHKRVKWWEGAYDKHKHNCEG